MLLLDYFYNKVIGRYEGLSNFLQYLKNFLSCLLLFSYGFYNINIRKITEGHPEIGQFSHLGSGNHRLQNSVLSHSLTRNHSGKRSFTSPRILEGHWALQTKSQDKSEYMDSLIFSLLISSTILSRIILGRTVIKSAISRFIRTNNCNGLDHLLLNLHTFYKWDNTSN